MQNRKSMVTMERPPIFIGRGITCGVFSISLLQSIQGEKNMVFPICLSTLINFLMFPFYLYLIFLSYIIFLYILMRFTPTTSPDSLIWSCNGNRLLSVYEYSYLYQFLLELLFPVSGYYLVMKLIDNTMTTLLVS